MIECTLMPLKQHGNLFPEDKEKVRYGRYLSSFYPIKGWGKKRWIVAVNVDVDHNKYIKEGMTLEEVAEKCAVRIEERFPTDFVARIRDMHASGTRVPKAGAVDHW